MSTTHPTTERSRRRPSRLCLVPFDYYYRYDSLIYGLAPDGEFITDRSVKQLNLNAVGLFEACDCHMSMHITDRRHQPFAALVLNELIIINIQNSDRV